MTTAMAGKRPPGVASGQVSHLYELWDGMTDGMVIYGSSMRRHYWNPAFEQLTDGAGAPAEVPFPNLAAPCRTRFGDFVRAVRAGHDSQAIALTVRRADGLQEVSVRLAPLAADHAATSPLMGVVTPIGRADEDPRAQRLEELEAALERVRDELQAVGIVVDVPTPLPSHEELAGLSGRELEVVMLLLRGHGVSSMAAVMHVSHHTVRNHVKSIYRKLGIHSRRDLVERFGSSR